MIFDVSNLQAILSAFNPQIILIITQIFMPFSIILIMVMVFLIYLLGKRLIIKKQYSTKNYIFIVIISLFLYYIIISGLILFMEIGLGRISQYI